MAYRIGVIGATGRGNYGHGLDRVWDDLPGCEVIAVADSQEVGRVEAAKRLGVKLTYEDFRTMLDESKPDVVSVAPRWIDQRHAMLLACAERGVHVYCEKPFVRSVAEANEVLAAFEKSGAKLAIAFQTRYSPILPVVRGLVDEGRIGQLLEIRARGKEDHRGGGEDLWVLGSHVLNLMHYFAGAPNWCFGEVLLEGQRATADDYRPGNEGIGPLVGDVVNAIYGFDDAVTGYFGSHRNAGAGGKSRFGIRLIGSKGQIEMGMGFLPTTLLLDDPLWSPGQTQIDWQTISSAGVGKPEPIADGGLHAGNVQACLDLLDAIEHDRQPEASIFEAVTSVQMIESVFASHHKQTAIKFD